MTRCLQSVWLVFVASLFCVFVHAKPALRGGLDGQYHSNEVFATVYNSSYELVTCYYDQECAQYFARDGINNLFYYPSDKNDSVDVFLNGTSSLGMNGLIWVPKHWINQGFDRQDYRNWVEKTARNHKNLYGWYMPDEITSFLTKPTKRNPIYNPHRPGMHAPGNPSKPWFFNKDDPDSLNTAIGRTIWYARRIREGDSRSHLIFSPGNGGAMGDLNRWVTTLEHLAPYCDVWVRGAYPNWVGRPRTMLLYEYDQWVQCKKLAKQRGLNIDNLNFMLILESFPGPMNNPVNYVPPEIIRFDAYASLTIGSQGLMWYEGKNWNNDDPEAQAMYAAIRQVTAELNVPEGVHLATCLLAEEPEQFIEVDVLSGPEKGPVYLGNGYDSIQLRLKQEPDDGPVYLFVANFAEEDQGLLWDSTGQVRARFTGFPDEAKKAQIVVDTRSAENRGTELEIKEGSFIDEIPSLTARVYQINIL